MHTTPTLPDFDTLLALHQKDPVAYEVLRKDLLQECVIDAPDHYQPMLDRLVWRIDAVRAAASSPIEAAAAAAALMLESVGQMRTKWVDLQNANVTWSTQIGPA